MRNRSGCSQPPTPLQILTYITYVSNILFTYTHIQILQEQLFHYIFFTLISLTSCYFSLKTTMSVPTDTLVVYQQSHRGEAFDYEQNQLTQFCDLCSAYVKESTKHCKACNRCCEDFDHHCRWINNCVGGLNYRPFIWMVVSTFLIFLYSIIIHGRVLNQYVLDKLNSQIIYFLNLYKIYHQRRKPIFAVSILFLTMDCIAFVLLFQLIVFHIYIFKKGLSTYEYIVNQRIQKISPQNSSEVNIINHQESKVEINKNDQEQTMVFRQEKDKNLHSQIYTNSDLKKEESSPSVKKISNPNVQNRKLTQGDSDDQQNNAINFYSQRVQTNVDFRFQQRQYAPTDIKTPELTQFQ